MRLSYFSAFLLTLFFLVLKFSSEILVTAFDLRSGNGLYSDWFKLKLSLSFIIPFVPVFIYYYFTRKAPLLSGEREFSSAFSLFSIRGILILLIVLLLIPVSFQILGLHIVWLSASLFPCNDTYRNMTAFLEPNGSLADSFGSFITIAFTGPVAEEVFFRGILMTSLLRRYGTRHLIPIILFQAFLFGASHMNVWQSGYAAAMGIVFGLIRYQSGGIFLPAAIHISSNFISVILMHLDPALLGYTSEDACEQIIPMPAELLLLAFLLMAGSLVIIRSLFRKAE